MKKTADAHWKYIEALTRVTMPAAGNTAADFTIDELIELIGFHYKTAFTHGWKHGLEALRADAAQQSRRSEAEAAFSAPSAAVSAVSGSARRVLDADNSVVIDAEIKETAEYIFESFLREDR